MPAAGHVGERPHVAGLAQAPHVLEVEPGRREQQVGVEARRRRGRRRTSVNPFACSPFEGRPSTASPGFAARAVHEVGAAHEADHRPREVELALAVDPGQLGRLAAEDGAAGLAADGGGAGDELGDLGQVELGRGRVVQEEERLGADGEQVVGAVRGEVDAGVEEPAGAAREDQLRARRRRSSPRAGARRRARRARRTLPSEPSTRSVRVDSTAAAQAFHHLLGLGQGDAGLAVRGHRRTSATSSRPSLGAALLEAHERVADEHVAVEPVDAEDLRERNGLPLRILRPQVELAEPELVGAGRASSSDRSRAAGGSRARYPASGGG